MRDLRLRLQIVILVTLFGALLVAGVVLLYWKYQPKQSDGDAVPAQVPAMQQEVETTAVTTEMTEPA